MTALRWHVPDYDIPVGGTARYLVDANEDARASVIGLGAHWRWAIYDLRAIQGGPDGPYDAFCTIAEGEANSEEQATAMALAVLGLMGHEVQP